MAFIYEAGRGSARKLPVSHDPDSKQYYGFIYRADTWSSTAEKIQASDIEDLGAVVVPTTVNGFFYECISSGITGSTEPTWPTEEDEEVADGTVLWKAHSDDLFIRTDDTLDTSTWTVDPDTVTLENDGKTAFVTRVQVTAISPATLEEFTLINHTVITRASGRVEEFDRSLTVKIKEK